ncbi:MAG: flagellar biosynthetic protein FliO [Acetobacteraceae bacterium]|nr:flagellar biosynthetic protein FliO [Acetobacteraceae bacterium]
MLPDLTATLSALAALIAVLALIAGAARLARYGGLAPKRPVGGRTLAIEETLALDARRRLLLVRCPHGHVLLLTGGAQDLVVGWLRQDKADP